ncbi:MAG TPA: HAD family phosphatase [Pirellulales bacterium]|nr:HAD family phosphatase [Pirellulales bacterium]
MRTPEFLYFDLGNVLLQFDHRLAARQMAQVAGVAAEKVWQVVFESDLELRYEAGEVDDRGFYEIFCRETSSRPDYHALLLAGSEIFTPNYSIIPVIAALRSAGYRLGILSNTNASHWAYCYQGRYDLVGQAFDVFALSYEIGVCKPASMIFEAAARLAGSPATNIFYVDDIMRNVEGALAAGFDAVQYTTTPRLVADLRCRGLVFNY